RLLGGLLGGAALVALAGLVVLAFNHAEAVQVGSTGVPSRFRGLGESANTASLLFGVALPLALWFVLRAPTARARWLAVGTFVLLVGSIVASGSRGALVGGFAGAAAAAFAAAESRGRRAGLIASLTALFIASFYIGTLPKPLSHSAPTAVTAPATHPKPGYVDANVVYPLSDDIGRPVPGKGETFVGRQAFGSSGRTAAWRGALHQAEQRPTVGYGFGTEDHVFVNRYHTFAGGVPEDSYIGLLLQLGAVGLASFLAIVGWWLFRAAGSIRHLQGQARLTLAGAAGVVIAGLVAAIVQSYVVSVGDIATVTFWISGFVVAMLAWRASAVEKGPLGTEGNS
ncbi:MAG TPA: O-antigen ligase family protein, partial [Gaiellaceae bacterium]|nr:O-antigen ligase family protein [Gaiellaceae bacterium]